MKVEHTLALILFWHRGVNCFFQGRDSVALSSVKSALPGSRPVSKQCVISVLSELIFSFVGFLLQFILIFKNELHSVLFALRGQSFHESILCNKIVSSNTCIDWAFCWLHFQNFSVLESSETEIPREICVLQKINNLFPVLWLDKNSKHLTECFEIQGHSQFIKEKIIRHKLFLHGHVFESPHGKCYIQVTEKQR